MLVDWRIKRTSVMVLPGSTIGIVIDEWDCTILLVDTPRPDPRLVEAAVWDFYRQPDANDAAHG